jgi:4-amino-4-deoxy-L-arabinose transferase-like glycosyltransferase
MIEFDLTQLTVALIFAINTGFLTFLALKTTLAKGDRAFAGRLFLSALSLRLAFSILAYYFTPRGFFAADELSFWGYGWDIAGYWLGINPQPYPQYNITNYQQLNAILFYVFGYNELIPRFLNCIIGALTAASIYLIGVKLFDIQTGRIAGILAAFSPSLVLWSALNLKDALAIYCVAVVVLNSLALQQRISVTRILFVFLGLIGISDLRGYLFIPTAVVAVWFVITPAGKNFIRNMLVAAFLTAVALTLFLVFSPGERYLSPILSEGVQRIKIIQEGFKLGAGRGAIAGSAFPFALEAPTLTALIFYLPLALIYFLLAPFPWQLTSLTQWLTFPEMVIWYFLVVKVYRGIRIGLRQNLREVLPILFLLALIIVSFATVISNVGTAYRFRALPLTFLLVFAAAGLKGTSLGNLILRKGSRA